MSDLILANQIFSSKLGNQPNKKKWCRTPLATKMNKYIKKSANVMSYVDVCTDESNMFSNDKHGKLFAICIYGFSLLLVKIISELTTIMVSWDGIFYGQI